MKLLFSVFLWVAKIVITSAYGMIAWNMSIPVIFTGAPEITLLQSIIISIVIAILSFSGNIYEDKTDTGSYISSSIIQLAVVLFCSTLTLGVLWLIMKFIY